MNISPTNVITFEYANNSNDTYPVVLVISVDDKYIQGINLNYLGNNKDDLTFRKYLRMYMDDIRNITEEIIPVPKKVSPDKVSVKTFNSPAAILLYDDAVRYKNTYDSMPEHVIDSDVKDLLRAADLAENGKNKEALRVLQRLDTIVRDFVDENVWDLLSGI